MSHQSSSTLPCSNVRRRSNNNSSSSSSSGSSSRSCASQSQDERSCNDAAPNKEPRPRRILIDYTQSKGPNHETGKQGRYSCRPVTNTTSNRDRYEAAPKITKKPNFSSFTYPEKLDAESEKLDTSDPTDERIEFFLKIRHRRSSESRIDEIRAGFAKMRSPKSPLFGSFTQNGEIRSSYKDLKDLLHRKELDEAPDMTQVVFRPRHKRHESTSS